MPSLQHIEVENSLARFLRTVAKVTEAHHIRQAEVRRQQQDDKLKKLRPWYTQSQYA
jgi:Flp pilus assembly protein TadD